MIINLYDLKAIMKEVLEDFDHKFLNEDTPYFKELIPTTENIAKVMWDIFHDKICQNPGCKLHRVRLYETDDLYVDYRRIKD